MAVSLIGSGRFGISAQVLQEFYHVVTRKGNPPLKPVKAMEWIELLQEQPCAAVDASLIKVGITVAARYKITSYDGGIVAAASALGAKILYTEDLSHGQSYDGVFVINPFLDMPPALTGFNEPDPPPMTGLPG